MAVWLVWPGLAPDEPDGRSFPDDRARDALFEPHPSSSSSSGQHGAMPGGDGSAGTSSSQRTSIRFLNINVSIGGKSEKQKTYYLRLVNETTYPTLGYLFLQLN